MALLLQFVHTPLQACMQFIGTLVGQLGVEAGVGLACPLLLFENDGAIVPVADLVGQTFADGGLRFVDLSLAPLADLFEMLLDEMHDGIGSYLLFEITLQPRVDRVGHE